jgi:hypothetical protein
MDAVFPVKSTLCDALEKKVEAICDKGMTNERWGGD